MKRFTHLALLLCFIVALLALTVTQAGCSASPAKQYEAASRTYILAANTLATAIDRGLIRDPQLLAAAKLASDEADAALDLAGQALRDNDPDSFRRWIRLADAALARLEVYLAGAPPE